MIKIVQTTTENCSATVDCPPRIIFKQLGHVPGMIFSIVRWSLLLDPYISIVVESTVVLDRIVLFEAIRTRKLYIILHVDSPLPRRSSPQNLRTLWRRLLNQNGAKLRHRTFRSRLKR